MDATSSDVPRRLRIFINYRREDTQGEARLLYDRLATRFGIENLFLDRRNLELGMKWPEEIKSHGGSCDVFLSLIGPRWISIMWERERDSAIGSAQDYVRSEIQRALNPNSGIRLIPVLIGDDVSLRAEKLPRSVRALADLEAAFVRPDTFEQDIAHLISRLEAIARKQPESSSESVPGGGEGPRSTPVPIGTRGVVPPPDAAHYEDVLQQMVYEGTVVPFLGARMTTGRARAAEGGVEGAVAGTPSLPDAEALAVALAERFGVTQTRLPELAQYVSVTIGRPDLYRALRRLLRAEREPGPVHRFLARFPGTLEKLGREKRYQLIVSTNFDTALEQAFDAEHEPYDLAVYMASGPDKGKFVHFPFQGAPVPIDYPNSYTGLPFGEEYELQRTVIVKIHGAVDGNVGDYRWRENYVITEDHYIDYLSKSPIESLVPTQVLGKLKESHCLFLGYTVRDWNLRVFLKRIWEGSLGAKSWAVEPEPDMLEKDIWAQSNVHLYTADLGEYVGLLQEMLS